MIEESGISVRVYKRASGSLLYREIRLEGGKDRKSLGHRDRQLADQQARERARLLAELRLTSHVGPVALGHLWRLYQQHRLPLLSPNRQAHTRQHAAFSLAHLGDGFRLDDLSQTHVDGFVRARRAGELGAKRRKPEDRAVRDDTIRQNLNWLASLLRWARDFRVNGRRRMSTKPLDGVRFPREKNVRRPVASDERYRKTLEKAPTVDASERLEMLLALARYTGRRINAMLQLRASDLLLSDGLCGADWRLQGSIRRSPSTCLTAPSDGGRKPTSRDTRTSPTQRSATPGCSRHARSRDRPMRKLDAAYYLRRAEDAAKPPHLDRGGFHAYRRMFAVERKQLRDVDVARARGWRDLATMKRSYQQPDPATTLRAIENETAGPIPPDAAVVRR